MIERVYGVLLFLNTALGLETLRLAARMFSLSLISSKEGTEV